VHHRNVAASLNLISTKTNETFIDMRLHPGIAMPTTWTTRAKRSIIHKTGSTQHIAMLSEEDRATATGDLHTKSIGSAVPEICSWTDRHTDRQTDHNTPLPYRGRVTNANMHRVYTLHSIHKHIHYVTQQF